MKRILALVNSYQTDNDKLFRIVLDQVKCYSNKSQYILVHFIRRDHLDKSFMLHRENVSDNLIVVTVEYALQKPNTLREKVRYNLSFINLVRMVSQVIIDEESIDQLHIHGSWPLILLGRELNNVRKQPVFLFEYDKDYLYLSYRKRNNLTIIPYLLVLFSAKSIQKIFAHSPKLISRVSQNLNIRRKAVIIPLAIDTQLFRYDKNIPDRNNIFIYYSEWSEYNIDDVVLVLKDILQEHSQYTAHVLIDDIEVYQNLMVNKGECKMNFYNHLNQEARAELLKSSQITIILDDDVQQMQIMNEALCCGNTIVSMDTVAVTDDLDESNSSLFTERKDEDLHAAILKAITDTYNPKNIAQKAVSRYNFDQVSQVLYREIRNF